MEATDTDNLARLRQAAVTGELPADLARWVLEVVTYSLPISERVASRNRYLRMAAAMLSGTVESKSSRLHRDAMFLRGVWPLYRDKVPDLSTPRGCVQAARQVDSRMPVSARQFRRIIEAPDTREEDRRGSVALSDGSGG